jgi:hypothetical protein
MYSEPVTLTVFPGGKLHVPLLVGNYPAPLPAPVLNPIDNADGDGTYIVSWSAVLGASAYTLEEATDETFAGAVEVYQGSNTSYGIGGRGPARYYYRVRASDTSKASGWSRVEQVDVVWEMEPNDSISQARGPMVSGLSYYGAFSSTGDNEDYFFFQLAAPFPVVELWLTNMADGSDYDLYLYDADGDLVAWSNDYGSADEYIQVPALTPGRYYVRVHRWEGVSSQPYHLMGIYR